LNALDAARSADGQARDTIARLLDAHLSKAPAVRMISARMLTRSLGRAAGNSARDIAADLGITEKGLFSRFKRAGGAGIVELRDEIVLTRLSFCFHYPAISWGIVAEAMGVRSPETLKRVVRRARHRSPGEWRSRASAAEQLLTLEMFLSANSTKWSRVKSGAAHHCPNCGHVLSTRGHAA
jgi:AraC-like DNA-binding protein